MLVSAAWVLVLLGQTSPTATANPAANAQARRVLDYLTQLPSSGEKRILSGQFTDYGPAANLALCDQAFKQTGHWPAMIGLDYADYSEGQHRLETATVNRLAIEYARQGGLVTISAHLPNPANPRGGGLRDKGVDLDTLLQEGHENHRRWMEELDILANGLNELKEAGVVVLWRPFHEMNGNWFWWGGRPGEHGSAALYRQLYDRFVQVEHLNNLVWVWNVNSPGGNAGPIDAFYPGAERADVVTMDIYSHLLPNMQSEVAATVDGVMRAAINKRTDDVG